MDGEPPSSDHRPSTTEHPGIKDRRVLVGLYGLLGFTILLVAGLDEGFDWPGEIPLGLQLAGLALFSLGVGFATWAILANAFFATTVRIQEDRGQEVTSGGPYRLVRHPAYAGWALSNGTVPLVLGSPWALVPAALTVAVLIVRTALEDRTLRAELEGYREYAQQVRYRLIPGIW